MPIITLEIIDSSNIEHPLQDETPTEVQQPGIHFLTEKNEEVQKNDDKETEKETPKVKSDLLEYMMRDDGSVICKLCGEILQSRTHWYRHKYKVHVIAPLNPTPLFQCEQCMVFFKSRKGYIGHIASRHSEILADSSPVLSNAQIEAAKEKFQIPIKTEDVKEETDPELCIPTTSVPNYQNVIKAGVAKPVEPKKMCKPRVSTGEKNTQLIKELQQASPQLSVVRCPRTWRPGDGDASRKSATSEVNVNADWEEKRLREEKLVADIIDRVRRECEAQGSGGSTRKGYSRRTTVTHS